MCVDNPDHDERFLGVFFAKNGCLACQCEELAKEKEQLRNAINKHRTQKADDRCWLDDIELYKALGDGVDGNNQVGDKAAMLENCKRYIERRCQDGGGWQSYAELEKERDELLSLVKRVAKVSEFSDDLYDESVACKSYLKRTNR